MVFSQNIAQLILKENDWLFYQFEENPVCTFSGASVKFFLSLWHKIVPCPAKMSQVDAMKVRKCDKRNS